MITIQTLTALTSEQMKTLIKGYVTDALYTIDKRESNTAVTIHLRLKPLPVPLVKQYDHLDAETVTRYQEVLRHGLSLGAFANGELVGLALAEAQKWNNSLWVWEFHVAAAQQRQGIGRQLMEALAAKAQAAGLRVIVCETQSSNVPAIRFYHQLGFTVEGIDLSYYTNEDRDRREIAIFMKRRLS